MDLQKRITNLPAKTEDLAEFILVGAQALKAQKAKLAAITAVKRGVAATQAALSDTQDLAEILLYAEARLGECLVKSNSKGTFKKGGETSLPSGFLKQRAYDARQLAKHPVAIAQVVAKARAAGEVPVRQHVLQEIKGVHVSHNSGQNE